MGTSGDPGVSTKLGGTVLNISSVQALMSWPIMPAYASAKAGIVTYTRHT